MFVDRIGGGLGVGPERVVHERVEARHGCLAVEAAVWSAVIVEAEPACECAFAFG